MSVSERENSDDGQRQWLRCTRRPTQFTRCTRIINILQVGKIARRLRRSLNKSIAFSFLRQLSTRHCPRLLPSAVLLSNRSISAARRSAAQPRSSGVRPTNDGTDRQTDGRTDGRWTVAQSLLRILSEQRQYDNAAERWE